MADLIACFRDRTSTSTIRREPLRSLIQPVVMLPPPSVMADKNSTLRTRGSSAPPSRVARKQVHVVTVRYHYQITRE